MTMTDVRLRSGGLDTLRGGAVLAVLVWHYLNNTNVFGVPSLAFMKVFTAHLFFGVDLFFVLSGFLIGGALMSSRGQPDYFSSYFARRAGRIFPLYYAWLAIFLFAIAMGAQHGLGGMPLLFNLDGFPVLSYLTFTQNFISATTGLWGPMWLGVTWTLAIEVHFYILAAIIVFAVPVRWMGLVALAVAAASSALPQYGFSIFDGHALTVITPARLNSPFIGVLCAWIWRSDDVRRVFALHATALKCAAVALIAFHYCSLNYGLILVPISGMVTMPIVFGFAVLAFAAPDRHAPPRPVRFMRWCGVRCYAIYLFHPGVLGIVSHLIFNWPPNVFPPGAAWPAILVALPITFGLTAASWRYFELPIMQWVARQRTGVPASLSRAMPSRPGR